MLGLSGKCALGCEDFGLFLVYRFYLDPQSGLGNGPKPLKHGATGHDSTNLVDPGKGVGYSSGTMTGLRGFIFQWRLGARKINMTLPKKAWSPTL